MPSKDVDYTKMRAGKTISQVKRNGRWERASWIARCPRCKQNGERRAGTRKDGTRYVRFQHRERIVSLPIPELGLSGFRDCGVVGVDSHQMTEQEELDLIAGRV